MFANPAPFSYSPRGFSAEDLSPPRRTLQHDDRVSPVQRNDMSRPNGKSIYLQRKEYSESLNRKSNSFHVRVEHLFTCELDGQGVRNMEDCVAQLKRFDAKGSVWPQEMILETQGGSLLLSDIETKGELESLPLHCIQQTKAVLDSCAYNSLLMVMAQASSRSLPQVFMFQCEETGADVIKGDLDKIIQSTGEHTQPRREPADIRSNLETIVGQHAGGGFASSIARPMMRERPPPPEYEAPEWNGREARVTPPSARPEIILPPQVYSPQREAYLPDVNALEHQEEPPLTPAERNTEIFNHVLQDLEIFVNKLTHTPVSTEKKRKDDNKKKKKNQKTAALPPQDEYGSCLQKIKYGFNLLAELDGELTEPSGPDYVHIFFSILSTIVPQYSSSLPPAVISPLLTNAALHLLDSVVTPEEDELWRSLGDSWNISSSRWPDGDVAPYIPDFYDGWLPPAPAHTPPSLPVPNGVQSFISQHRQEEPASSLPWAAAPARPAEPTLYMRVMYDFLARNNRELSIMKGEEVQVVQKSKQWWLVRNSRGVEGNVPQNVLESIGSEEPVQPPRETHRAAALDMTSSPAEVRAWLEHKGFSKITSRSLGVLNGKLLLAMSREELKMVCPEEGSKVFFHLQAIKSAIALASEPSLSSYRGGY